MEKLIKPKILVNITKNITHVPHVNRSAILTVPFKSTTIEKSISCCDGHKRHQWNVRSK